MKNKLTSYNFWISIVSAVLLIFQAFNFQFDIEYINEIVTAVLGLLVVIGIITNPTKSSDSSASSESEDGTKDGESSEENESSDVPTDGQDAVNNSFDENNFEVLVKQISTDINKKMSEFYETLSSFNADEESTTNGESKSETSTEVENSAEIETETGEVLKVQVAEDETINPQNETENEVQNESETEIESQQTCHNIVN